MSENNNTGLSSPDIIINVVKFLFNFMQTEDIIGSDGRQSYVLRIKLFSKSPDTFRGGSLSLNITEGTEIQRQIAECDDDEEEGFVRDVRAWEPDLSGHRVHVLAWILLQHKLSRQSFTQVIQTLFNSQSDVGKERNSVIRWIKAMVSLTEEEKADQLLILGRLWREVARMTEFVLEKKECVLKLITEFNSLDTQQQDVSNLIVQFFTGDKNRGSECWSAEGE